MQSTGRIAGLLRKRVLILDGAMGTELHKRGLPVGACPEAWCLANPEAVAQIHKAYREAGADIVYTATFGANRLKLGQYDVTNIRELNRELAAVAKRAVGRTGLVAGDMGPTGHFVEPFGDLAFDEAVGIFREQAQGLLEGGVDCFVIETMMDIQEARAALIAVREVSDLFVMATMTYEKHGRTLNGTDPVSALITLQSLGADAVGCNCSAGPEAMLEMILRMKPHARVPLVAKPNAGLPHLVGEETVFDMDAEAFADFGGRFAAAGVNLMGGCCGTTPAHIAALRKNLAAERPVAPVHRPMAAVSSARNTVFLDTAGPLIVAGGRINAADDEAMHQGLVAGELTAVCQAAREQGKEGASLLMVKVASAGVDETETIPRVIVELSPTTRLPFLIEAGLPEALEKALRVYPGRALARLAGGWEEWTALLPIAVRYGAIPVLGCPAEAGPTVGRSMIRGAVKEAGAYGLTKDDIVIEVSAAGAIPPREVLRTALGLVAWCSESIGCRTLLDLTGLGSGLPERQWLQAAFLAAVQVSGLTVAILDPASKEMMHIRAGGNYLLGKDPEGAAWGARFG